MESSDLNKILDTWGKSSKLEQITNIKSWIARKLVEVPENIQVDEFGYCENKSKRELLKELNEFLITEINTLKNAPETKTNL